MPILSESETSDYRVSQQRDDQKTVLFLHKFLVFIACLIRLSGDTKSRAVDQVFSTSTNAV